MIHLSMKLFMAPTQVLTGLFFMLKLNEMLFNLEYVVNVMNMLEMYVLYEQITKLSALHFM